MKKDYSFGIVPLKKIEGKWNALLIKHKNSAFWGFPKGHADEGEEPYHTAVRELREETGLSVKRPLCKEPLTENYRFRAHGKWIDKTVVYFVAEVEEGEIALQPEEIEACCWLPFDKAEEKITYDQAKSICRQAREKVST